MLTELFTLEIRNCETAELDYTSGLQYAEKQGELSYNCIYWKNAEFYYYVSN